MYYVKVEGKSSSKGDYSHQQPTNLEVALDDLERMVYSAKAQGYGNLRILWLDTGNPDGWEDITSKYMGRK